MKAGIDFIGVNVGFLCHDGQGNILLHLRSAKCRDEHNTWDAGGGRVEFGETLDKAVRREILEEYGCEALKIDHLTQLELHREHDGKNTHWLANVYIAKINRDDVRIMEPEKNLENKWYTLNTLPKPLHSVWAIFLEDYKVRINELLH